MFAAKGCEMETDIVILIKGDAAIKRCLPGGEQKRNQLIALIKPR